MVYTLKDRSDGQVEIVFSRPVLVGVFPERNVAQRICAFLEAGELAMPDDEPATFARAAADVVAAQAEDMNELADEVAPRPVARKHAARNQLPALIDEKPHLAAQKFPEHHNLSDGQITAAFARIQNGEKIHAVAVDYGLTMGQLRGMWANHKRNSQRFMASAGQQPCSLCAKPFTPSLTNPGTCARCSK
ncbi:MAG: hypothetical protein DI498_10885 [Paracoccus denitrificans]|nr:MAG: hypothetical protein DI498_10885 [Paracoccus denitrificans]PZO83647.1 MAG: hypothetical protein DI633_10885 [Paracoccus denitrificans]